MDISDITTENFFKKVTYASDPEPEPNQLVLPDGEFLHCALMLKLIGEISKLL